MAATAKSKPPYIPLAGCADDGWVKEDEATATCFCGAVQLAFVSLAPDSYLLPLLIPRPNHQPTQRPGLIDTFICNCTDCRKITASMFASNFTVADAHLKHLRGRDNLRTFSQSRTIASGNTMTNYFCSTCGTLMYRVGSAFPGQSILRIGTVDRAVHVLPILPILTMRYRRRYDIGIPNVRRLP
ncbi:Mss4-like protein, partial [Lipomyces doorenjongii]